VSGNLVIASNPEQRVYDEVCGGMCDIPMTIFEWLDPKKHGYDISYIKQWRTLEHEAGRPSGLEDFFKAHGLCLGCRGAGRTVTGVWWRDSGSEKRSFTLEGSSESIASLHEKYLKDSSEWNYTYSTCPQCEGSGKAVSS